MRVLVVGGGGREHALVHAFARVAPLLGSSSAPPATPASPPRPSACRSAPKTSRRCSTFARDERDRPHGRRPRGAARRRHRRPVRRRTASRSSVPAGSPRSSRAASCSPRRSWPRPASRPARYARFTDADAAPAHLDGADVVPARRQGRRPRGRQGRDHLRRRSTRRAAAVATCLVDTRLRRGRRRRARRGVPAAAPRSRCWRSATARPWCRWRRRRTTSASSPATRGPNTGGMGSYCPVPGFDERAVDAVCERVFQPVDGRPARRAASTTAGVLYARPHRHRGRRQGARVQLPLRRPRDAGGPAAPDSDLLELCPAAPTASSPEPGSPGSRGPASRSCMASGGYPASSSQGRRHQRPDEAAAPDRRDRLPRRHGAEGRRRRHRRRPRAGRERARRRLRRGARARLRRASRASTSPACRCATTSPSAPSRRRPASWICSRRRRRSERSAKWKR